MKQIIIIKNYSKFISLLLFDELILSFFCELTARTQQIQRGIKWRGMQRYVEWLLTEQGCTQQLHVNRSVVIVIVIATTMFMVLPS